MILNCSNISKTFIDDTILNNVSFHVEDGEKAAIVGANGVGKSTLLKIIIGELTPDDGSVTISKDKTMGYLAQHQSIDGSNTIYEEVLSVKQDVMALELSIRQLEIDMKNAKGDVLDEMLERYTRLNHEFEQQNGYAVRSEITGVIKGLGFTEEEFDKKISSLSGGQKTRVALCRLLLTKPDILLLDEPTNHLDLPSISWLETYLKNYQGSVIIVSHDRYFLDKIVTKVIEIDRGNVTVFSGSYSDYSVKKAALRDAEMKAYLNSQREIKHQQEVIDKLKQFNREKSIKRAESREKLLSKMEVVDKPLSVSAGMRIDLEPSVVSGNDVLTVTDLSKSFGNNHLFSNINFEIKRGERVALIGANGTGKTTILKIINGIIDADSGTCRLGANVTCGYYDQEHQVLDMNKTLFDEIQDTYPDMNNTKVRNVLAAFLFTDDDVFKRIGELSGGERGRVLLAKLMLSNANFLLLDEPTNHLDMASKEILESALNKYTGTCFFVSHDRYFINTVATRILDLRNNTITNYIGNYDYYLEKSVQTPASASSKAAVTVSASKEDRILQKEEQAKERRRKNEIEKCEKEISEIDEKLSEIDSMLTKEEIYTDINKLTELSNQKSELEQKQNELYEKWESLM